MNLIQKLALDLTEALGQVDLLVVENDVKENQIQSLTKELTEALSTIHLLEDTCFEADPVEDINEELQLASQIHIEPQITASQTIVPVGATVNSIVAQSLEWYDRKGASSLTTDDLLKLAEFKRIWNASK